MCSSVKRAGVRVCGVLGVRAVHRTARRGVDGLPARLARGASGVDRRVRAPCKLYTSELTSNQARLPAEFKHITKRRKRN